MRIDVHAHYWTDAYLDMLVEPRQIRYRDPTWHRRGRWRGTRRTAAADGSRRHRRPSALGGAAITVRRRTNADGAAAAARYVNDEYAALVSLHPDRFRAFAATPMPHIDAAIAEIRGPLTNWAWSALTMNTSILDRAITDPEFEPVFAELDRRGAILYLHPVGNGACSPLVSEHHITWMVGAPFEDTIAAMQLITSGHLQTLSRGEDHLFASGRCATDDPASRRRPRRMGDARHSATAQPGCASTLVRHRKPLPRSGIAMCHRHVRLRPDPVGHRFPLRGRRHIRPGSGLHRRDGTIPARRTQYWKRTPWRLFGIRA